MLALPHFFFRLSSSFISFYFYFYYFGLLIQYLRPLTQQQPPFNCLNLPHLFSPPSPSGLGCTSFPTPIIPNRSPSSKQHVSSLALRFPTPLPSHHRFRIRAISPLRYASTHEVNLNALEKLSNCRIFSPCTTTTDSSYHPTRPPPKPRYLVIVMSTKGRSTPRVVCCAIPIARAAGKVLVITSRKRPNHWVCECIFFTAPLRCFSSRPCADSALQYFSPLKYLKAVGSPRTLHSRLLLRERPWKKVESFVPLRVPPHPDVPLVPCPHLLFHPPTAGVRGTITRFVTTVPSAASTYHFYELDVASLDADWLESKERRREWVDFAEAMRRVAWKPELAQGLALSSLAPRR